MNQIGYGLRWNYVFLLDVMADIQVIKKFFFFLLFLLFIASCIPQKKRIELDESMVKMLRKEVSIYDKSELDTGKYQIIEPIQATSCNTKLWDPAATREDAIDRLRYETYLKKGNAIIKLFCEPKESVSLIKDCFSSVTCYGVAVKVIRKY